MWQGSPSTCQGVNSGHSRRCKWHDLPPGELTKITPKRGSGKAVGRIRASICREGYTSFHQVRKKKLKAKLARAWPLACATDKATVAWRREPMTDPSPCAAWSRIAPSDQRTLLREFIRFLRLLRFRYRHVVSFANQTACLEKSEGGCQGWLPRYFAYSPPETIKSYKQ